MIMLPKSETNIAKIAMLIMEYLDYQSVLRSGEVSFFYADHEEIEGIGVYEKERVMSILEKKDAIRVLEFKYVDELTSRYKYKINRVAFDQLYIEYQNLSGTKNSQNIFRFSKGILHKDGHDGVLIFREKSQEFYLLSILFEQPFGERIDGAYDFELTGRQIPDTAKRINEKVEDEFGIKSFLEIDFSNKYTKRIIE